MPGASTATLGVVLGIVAVEALREEGSRLAARNRGRRVRRRGERPVPDQPVDFPGACRPIRCRVARRRRDSRAHACARRSSHSGAIPPGSRALARDPGRLPRLSRSAYRAGAAARGARAFPSASSPRSTASRGPAAQRDGRSGPCRHGADGHAPRRAGGGRRDDRRRRAGRRDAHRHGRDRRRRPASSRARSTSFPARVDFTLDARAPDDVVRHAMVEDIIAEWQAIAAKRHVALQVEPFMDSPATPMDPLVADASRRPYAVSEYEPTLACLGRRPRRGRHGGSLPRRHAVRALRGRHQPQPGRIDHASRMPISPHAR